ncbi:MAG: gephyrin-like molybdotransferase Glp [Pseudomonadota bacterium]
MKSVAEAQQLLLAPIGPTASEDVPISQALGRVLAEPLQARRTQPPFAASAMDGYAVRRADALPGRTLEIIGEAPAGHAFDGSVGPGQAVRIFTGAPVPDGADDILIQEDAIRTQGRIEVAEGRDTASYIRPAGQDFTANMAFPDHGPLRPSDIALLAAMGHRTLPVRRQPTVALIATGDELVLPGEPCRSDQIVSSNSYGLAAQLQAAGAQARILPIARDTIAGLTAVLDLARGADLVVTLGGASVGDHDLVQTAARDRGLKLSFYKIAMRPGKPLMAGTLFGAPMIGLPGNPVSAMVCGHLFVLPVVRRMLGLEPLPPVRHAALAAAVPPNGPRAHYMRGRTEDDGRITAFERQDSSLLSVLQAASVLVIRPPHAAAAAAGDKVEIIDL